ncbi:MAG: DNA polymerase I [Ignavibacteria bacterium]|nr:DNA polymerase I [Ignavibacteria bacterium]
MPKIYLIDSMGLVFRAFHALAKLGLKTPDGEPTSAVFGFANIIGSLIDREKPDYVAAVFDTKEPTFRHTLYDQYKANRLAFPEELIPQLPRIKQLIDALGILRIEMPGYEADDIVGTMARLAAEQGMEVCCITSDKDYFQLVGDKVNVLRPGKDATEYDIYGREEVKTKFGVYPEHVIDVLALMGDSSDNVPGVRGVGDKSAIPLIEKYGSVENLYANLHEIERESLRKKLEDSRDMAFLSKELVTIHQHVPIEISIEDCKRNDPHLPTLDALLTTLNFNSLRLKWGTKDVGAEPIPTSSNQRPQSIGANSGSTQEPEATTYHTVADIEHDYTLVATTQELNAMMIDLQTAEILSFDLETTSLDTMGCSIVGVALSSKEGKAYYIATDDSGDDISILFDAPKQAAIPTASLFDEPQEVIISEDVESVPGHGLPLKFVLMHIKPLLESVIPKLGQNAKFDAIILRRFGVNVSPITFDTMLASYILNPDQQHGMDALAKRWMNYIPIPISDLIGEKKQGSMRDVPLDKAAEYAAEDADVTLKLRNILYQELVRDKLLPLAQKVEFPLIEVLVEMESNGVKIDTAALSVISEKIKIAVAELRTNIFKESLVEFNIDSPKQVGDMLFDKMMLPHGKKTKTGYSTDVSVLSELAESYPIAGMILEHRQLQKLQSTYVESLPRMVNPRTGRVHTTYNQTIAGTGRLSSVEPNLQNIPIRTEIGRSIRKAFVPKAGAKLLSADYSQIELRVIAHVCGDETLIHAFQNGLDIHSATAAALFGIDIANVTSAERRIAKTVNFGIMYGQGSFGLAQQLSISRAESKKIIEQYFEKYPRIKNYIEDTKEFARQNGYVATLLGRRRYFPTVTSNNATIRQAAERAAINMPIQGTAADMMKLAMIDVHKQMKAQKLESKMLLQIHDELVFEAVDSEVEQLSALVKKSMESAFPLGKVPVLVEVGIGMNWDEAH